MKEKLSAFFFFEQYDIQSFLDLPSTVSVYAQ